MAKKIRFPLKMKGTDIRTIEELRDNFDLESVLGYYMNGKLVTWLKNRYYDNEAGAIENLSADDAELNQKLKQILGIFGNDETEEIDMKAIQRRNEKLVMLRQITDDKEVIDNIDCVAFNQEDLSKLLKEGKKEIYLCRGEFEISVYENGITYTGIDNPTVSIVSNNNINLENIKLYNVKCISDSSDVLLQLGMYYENGTVVEQNYIKAVECFERAAEQGNVQAQFKLGQWYENGGKDYKKAVEWYHKAAEQGYADAQCNLGECYGNGKGVEQSWEQAVEWYRKAAEQGNARAQCNLGWCYKNDKGIAEDKWYHNYKKAAEWYRKAAEQGNAEAQYYLGEFYERGYGGIRKNLQEAMRLYRLSIEQGNISAQCGLGRCYENGEGVEQDYKKAVECYCKAAEQGNAEAQYNLSMCYRLGRGVPSNIQEAERLRLLSAEQGYRFAKG